MTNSTSARQLTAGQLTGQNETHLTSHQGQRLHQGMLAAFIRLQQAAAKDGFDLQVASGFRSFDRQLLIWNNKFNGSRPLLDSRCHQLDPDELTVLEKIHAIMRWSALPGASRHHWGTDIDVYAANCLPSGSQLHLEPWEYQPGGPQAEFSAWLNEKARDFGFYLPYAEDRNGIAAEPWHISYYPISQSLLKQLTPELLYHTLKSSQIAGKSQILANLDSLYRKYIENICEV